MVGKYCEVFIMFFQNTMLFILFCSVFLSSFAQATCYRCEQIREENKKNASKEITYYDDHIEKINPEEKSKKDSMY